MSKQAGFLNGYGIAPVPGSNVNHSLVVPTDPKLPAEQGERCDYDNAEEVGFEPTDPCRSHDFQSCRFGRSRTPPRSLRPLSLHLLALSCAVAGFCATGDRESSQGRKAAALSGFACVPQGTWLLRTAAPELGGALFRYRASFLCTRGPSFGPREPVFGTCEPVFGDL